MIRQIVTTERRFPKEELEFQISQMLEAYKFLFEQAKSEFPLPPEVKDALINGEPASFTIKYPDGGETTTTIQFVIEKI